MKLYKICGYLAFMSILIGMAGICGAIECGTNLRWPVGILLFGCACTYIAIRESGGYIEIEEDEGWYE